MGRTLYELETRGAGLRVTRDAERVELLVRVGSATFAAKLTTDQAEQLALALLRGVPARNDRRKRRLRAVPVRVTTEAK